MYNCRSAGLAAVLFSLIMMSVAVVSQTTTTPTSTIPFSTTIQTTMSTTVPTTVPASTTVGYSSTYLTSTVYTTASTTLTTILPTTTIMPSTSVFTTTIPISSTIVQTTTVPATTVQTTTIPISSTIITTTIPVSNTTVFTTTIFQTTTVSPTTTIIPSTTAYTTTIPGGGGAPSSAGSSTGGALPGMPSGYGAPVPPPSVSKSGTSCYALTSIAERSPFSISIGNQNVGLISSYINPNDVGITINNQRYQLNLNQPMKIPGTNLTITLTSVSLQSVVSTASFEACGPTVPFIPPSQRVVNVTFSISPFVIINRSSNSVFAFNVPANLPMAPNGFRIVAIDNISANALQFGIINITAQYNCTLKGLSPFIFSQSAFSWNPLNYSYRNSSTVCALKFSVPNGPIIAIMQNMTAVVPERPPGNQTNATGTAKPKGISYNVIIAAIAIAIGAILLVIALLRKGEDSNSYGNDHVSGGHEFVDEAPQSTGLPSTEDAAPENAEEGETSA